MTGSTQDPETADVDAATDAYAARFAGPTGQWMLAIQERRTRELLTGLPGASILDVGGGHGQLARPLSTSGHPMTVLASAEVCRHRLRDLIDSGACAFRVGNLLAQPFSDRSFEVSMSFRMLTHCPQWPKLIKELCRVARSTVIVDYPTSQSLNAIAPALFAAKRGIEGNTREFNLFRHQQVAEAFAACGFRVDRRAPQFFFPMVLHRLLHCQPLSAAIEAACNALPLTRRWGSPVIIRATRIDAR